MIAIKLLLTLCIIEVTTFTDFSMSFKNRDIDKSLSKVKREISYDDNADLDEIFLLGKHRKNFNHGETLNADSEKRSSDSSDFVFDGPISSYPNEISQRSPKVDDSESDFIFPDDPRLKKIKIAKEINQVNGRNPIHSYGNHYWNNILNQWQWIRNDAQKPHHLNNNVYPPERPNPCQISCHQKITMEYNPICGSDGVTYYNPGKFKCARQCGRSITGQPYRTCGAAAPKI